MHACKSCWLAATSLASLSSRVVCCASPGCRLADASLIVRSSSCWRSVACCLLVLYAHHAPPLRTCCTRGVTTTSSSSERMLASAAGLGGWQPGVCVSWVACVASSSCVGSSGCLRCASSVRSRAAMRLPLPGLLWWVVLYVTVVLSQPKTWWLAQQAARWTVAWRCASAGCGPGGLPCAGGVAPFARAAYPVAATVRAGAAGWGGR